MEKTLTINDVFYFVNQAMERGAVLNAGHYSPTFWISCNNFNICHEDKQKKIIIGNGKFNDVELNISDIESAQFKVLWEKVKQYSKNMLVDKFLTYFKKEDNSEKTIDDIDD